MISSTAAPPRRSLSVLFVGNSLISTNDLPAMLTNIASSDPGNTTKLAVKAVTRADANLLQLKTESGALDWAQAHRSDFVVLQPRSHWYNSQHSAAATLKIATEWRDALQKIGQSPILFQVWSDGERAAFFVNSTFGAFTRDVAVDAKQAVTSTEWMARRLGGLPVVPVGEAFERARKDKAAPDLYRPDQHQPNLVGTYLAALVFYRHLTGRSGAEATYRPDGLSIEAAKFLAETISQ